MARSFVIARKATRSASQWCLRAGTRPRKSRVRQLAECLDPFRLRWCSESNNDSGVSSAAGAPTTIDADVTPGATTDIIETEFATSIDIGLEQVLWCRFWRDVANDNGNDVGEVRFCEIEYVANKLGEAT